MMVVFVVVFVFFVVEDASACAVCFSPAEPTITQSLNAGIFVLLGVTAVVLGGFVHFIVTLARRSGSGPGVGERPPAPALAAVSIPQSSER